MAKNFTITYEKARAVLENGGAVLLGGDMIDHISKLPPPEFFAHTSEDVDIVAKGLEDQIAELTKRLQGLSPAQQTAEAAAIAADTSPASPGSPTSEELAEVAPGTVEEEVERALAAKAKK